MMIPNKIFLKWIIGTNDLSFFLDQRFCFFETHFILFHDESDDKSRRSTDTHNTVNQNIMFLKVLFYIKMSLIKVRINVLVLEIFKINPFMMFYLHIFDLFLDLEFNEGCGIHDCQNAVYLEVFFDLVAVKRVDAREIEIAFVFRRSFLVNVQDMTAGHVISH